MRRFIIGRVGRFEVCDSVHVQPASTGHEAFTGKPVKIAASLCFRKDGRYVSYTAGMKRGVAVEGPGYYVRVMPEDAEEALADIDRRLTEAQAAVRAMYDERQAFLAAHVVRGERVTVKKHVQPAPTPAEGARGPRGKP